MELKKTTILSAFVLVCGILAEIIFRDTLSKSYVGVALSVALAVVVLVAFYFTVDGVYCLESLRREEASKQQKEYEQRVYSVLNEQLKFQKAVYSEVKNLQQQLADQQMKFSEITGEFMDVSEPSVNLQQMQETANITKEDLMHLVSEMNDHTTLAMSDVNDHTTLAMSDVNDHTTQVMSEMNAYIAQAMSDMNDQITQVMSEMNDHTAQAVSEMNGNTLRAISEMNDHTAQTVSEINDHTMQAAKIVAKLVGKSAEEIKEEVRNH